MKEEMLELMKSQDFCVLSTVDENGLPESALIGFSQNKKLELLFGTSRDSRKYKNLKCQPNVSVVVSLNDATIQYEGEATQINAGEQVRRLPEHFKNLPGAAKYLDDPAQVWFVVRPKWARLTVSGEPTRVEELRQFS